MRLFNHKKKSLSYEAHVGPVALKTMESRVLGIVGHQDLSLDQVGEYAAHAHVA